MICQTHDRWSLLLALPMKKIVFVLMTTFAGGCSAELPGDAVTRATSEHSAESYRNLIASIAERHAITGDFSGAVGLSLQGYIVYVKAFGQADRQRGLKNTVATKFNVGSVGKLITGVAIAQLWEAGKIDLDRRIVDYLPEVEAIFEQSTTVRHLLTHTSGADEIFAYEELDGDLERAESNAELFAIALGLSPVGPPGGEFSYCNTNFVVLAELVASLSGLSFENYVIQNIFMPAGMQGALFARSVNESGESAVGYLPCTAEALLVDDRCEPEIRNGIAAYPYESNFIYDRIRTNGAGGLFATASDMLAFANAWSDGSLLARSTFAEACSHKVAHRQPGRSYGLACSIFESSKPRYVGHNGGAPGIQASLAVYPDSGVIVVILSNHHRQARPVLDEFQAGLLALQ